MIVSERQLHDQLPGAGRQGAARRDRHRARPMTTIHAYTNDQKIARPDPQRHAPRPRGRNVDHPDHHRRRPRGRARCCPELKGKLDGSACSRCRRPTSAWSTSTFTPTRDTDQGRGELRSLKAAAGRGPLAGILDYTDEPLVIDRSQRQPSQLDRRQPRERGRWRASGPRGLSWYDNECGLLEPMIDTRA